jgi:hypothetical protein
MRTNLLNMTDQEHEAVEWAKGAYGRRWRSHVLSTLDDLPENYKRFYWQPFGIPEWNYNIHLVRTYFAREHGYNYPDPERGANSINCEEFTLKSALRFWGIGLNDDDKVSVNARP